MSNNNNNDIKNVPLLHLVISTGFGTGFVPIAPGTAGAFLALLIWIGLYFLLSPLLLFLATLFLIISCFVVGVWTDNVMERYWGSDPRAVVIDEFFGTWIAVLAATFVPGPCYLTIILAFVGFVLFRVIDITKPLGCRWIDNNVHGGLGCMLDDALAGVYALILTLLIKHSHIIEFIHNKI